MENNRCYESQTQTINTEGGDAVYKGYKAMVEFLKKLNILLVSRDKEHCQQRRMVIPEDKE